MKRLLWALFLIPAALARAEQPLHETGNPFIDHNFQDLNYALDQHQHKGDGTSRRMDYLPLKEIDNPTDNALDEREGGCYIRDGYFVLFFSSAGVTNYVKILIDGSATTWSAGAP
jgi:hypothetical protein